MDTTSPHYLSLRLTPDDARLMEQLRAKMGISKSEVVKQAVRLMASQVADEPESNAFTLGSGLFGRYGDANRQSSDIKQLVKQRLAEKRGAPSVGR
jgi:Arc/MetJ-type ribon-helix-helix transcriptional regulator